MEVYAFGPNASTEFGEKGDVIIGAGQVQTFDTPQCIETLFNAAVVAIAAGHDHTAFMCRSTKNNALELRTCGSNDTGQLGLPWVIDQADKWAPTKVEMKDLYAAEHASALAKAAKLMALRRRERRRTRRASTSLWRSGERLAARRRRKRRMAPRSIRSRRRERRRQTCRREAGRLVGTR